MNYIYTISGSRSEEDAKDMMIGILETEHSSKASERACEKGFKRVLAQTNDEIDKRLKRMHNNSQGEYSYKGVDGKSLAIYTFWGIL